MHLFVLSLNAVTCGSQQDQSYILPVARAPPPPPPPPAAPAPPKCWRNTYTLEMWKNPTPTYIIATTQCSTKNIKKTSYQPLHAQATYRWHTIQTPETGNFSKQLYHSSVSLTKTLTPFPESLQSSRSPIPQAWFHSASAFCTNKGTREP